MSRILRQRRGDARRVAAINKTKAPRKQGPRDSLSRHQRSPASPCAGHEKAQAAGRSRNGMVCIVGSLETTNRRFPHLRCRASQAATNASEAFISGFTQRGRPEKKHRHRLVRPGARSRRKQRFKIALVIGREFKRLAIALKLSVRAFHRTLRWRHRVSCREAYRSGLKRDRTRRRPSRRPIRCRAYMEVAPGKSAIEIPIALPVDGPAAASASRYRRRRRRRRGFSSPSAQGQNAVARS